jgi:hypothetical protein
MSDPTPIKRPEPQDHKPKTEPFTWTAPDGGKVTLIPFDRIPAGVFRKARGGDELEQTFSLIEAATDEDGLEVVDRLPVGDLENLFADWSAAAGVDSGES